MRRIEVMLTRRADVWLAGRADVWLATLRVWDYEAPYDWFVNRTGETAWRALERALVGAQSRGWL